MRLIGTDKEGFRRILCMYPPPKNPSSICSHLYYSCPKTLDYRPMKLPTSLRIMNYAVNGIGLGHLSRLVAVNRSVRRYTDVLGIDAELLFLTSSEADALCFHNDFPAFKIPSKTIIGNARDFSSPRAARLSRQQHRRLAKQWVWNSVGIFAPDILVVDTFPNGSFHELGGIADFGMKKVLISRAVRQEQAQKPDFQAALRMYDRIITTEEPFPRTNYLPEEAEGRTHSVGTIMLREREELLSREEARLRLGLPSDALCVYVSAGGGGDSEAESAFATLATIAASEPHICFVFAAGALYRGREFHEPNVRWLQRFNAIEFMPAFDAAISAGGYNSVYELLLCGIPTVFVAQERLFDDQKSRVVALQERGLCAVESSWSEESCRSALRTVQHPAWRQAVSAHIQAFVLVNDAYAAARLVLEEVVNEELLQRADELLSSGTHFELVREGFDERLVLRTFFALDFTFRRNEQRRKAAQTLGLPYTEQAEDTDVPDLAATFLRECRQRGLEALARVNALSGVLPEVQTAAEAVEQLLSMS
jgi:predicted glycosyltransferase